MLLVALQLLVRAQAVTLGRTRSSLGILLWLLRAVLLLLLLLLLSNTKRRLQRGLLAQLCLLLPAGILELVVHCASAYRQPHDLPTLLGFQPRTYQRVQVSAAQTSCQRTCATYPS